MLRVEFGSVSLDEPNLACMNGSRFSLKYMRPPTYRKGVLTWTASEISRSQSGSSHGANSGGQGLSACFAIAMDIILDSMCSERPATIYIICVARLLFERVDQL